MNKCLKHRTGSLLCYRWFIRDFSINNLKKCGYILYSQMSGVNSVAYWKKMAESNWKQRSFAWAKFYEEVQANAHTTSVMIRYINISVPRNAETGDLERPAVLPPHITEEFMDMAIKLAKEFTCPCCFELMDKDTIHIAFCGHYVCKGCYEMLAINVKGKKPCPTCRKNI